MITQAVLTTSAADLFASLADNTAIVCIYLCNTTAAAQTFTLHVKDVTGTASAVGNMIYDTVNVPAHDTFVIDGERLILDTGNVLNGLASANTAITVTISSMEC